MIDAHPLPIGDDPADADSTATPSLPSGWQPLPARARTLFVAGTMLPLAQVGALVGAGTGLLSSAWLETPARWLLIVGGALAVGLVAGLFGWWLGANRYRRMAWQLDDSGLAVRRGRLWERETRVPANRVQHLDVKRGPWQRRRRLATLVVHTAGTRNSAVSVPHLDDDDAERLRGSLGRQIDHEDD